MGGSVTGSRAIAVCVVAIASVVSAGDRRIGEGRKGMR